jgi:hypothetical protein
MNYSQALQMSEQMKQFEMFQAFIKFQETTKTPVSVKPLPTQDPRMREAYQTHVANKRVFNQIDWDKFIPKTLQKVWLSKDQDNAEGSLLLYAIRALCEAQPERLVVQGGIHNNDDGSKTYVSASVKMSETLYYNLHFYGALRGNFFTTKSIAIHGLGKEVVVQCDPPKPLANKCEIQED